MGNHMLNKQIQKVVEAAVDGDTDQCLNINLHDDDQKWVQVTWDMINAFYPYENEPQYHLTDLCVIPSGSEIIDWKAGQYVTIKYDTDDVNEIRTFIIAYLSLLADRKITEPELLYNIEIL